MELSEQLKCFLDRAPRIHPDAWVHPQATLIGAVTLADGVSIWPQAVLRADINAIEVGEGSNLQDGVVVHLADRYGVQVGSHVTVGHLALLHACQIQDECLIGMHATIMDGACVGARSIIGAGAVVTQGMVIPAGSMVLGTPARIVRLLTIDEQRGLKAWAEKYRALSRAYRSRGIG